MHDQLLNIGTGPYMLTGSALCLTFIHASQCEYAKKLHVKRNFSRDCCCDAGRGGTSDKDV